MSLSIEEVNDLIWEEFGITFTLRCPVIAAAIWTKKPFSSLDDIHHAACSVIDGFSLPGRLLVSYQNIYFIPILDH